MFDLTDLLDLCEAYSAMGGAIQEQLHDILKGADLEEQNPNALRYISDFLDNAQQREVDGAWELQERIDNYLTEMRRAS